MRGSDSIHGFPHSNTRLVVVRSTESGHSNILWVMAQTQQVFVWLQHDLAKRGEADCLDMEGLLYPLDDLTEASLFLFSILIKNTVFVV